MAPWMIPAAIAGGAALSAIGSTMSGQESARQMRKNRQLQREFAQHGVSWRVEDAKRAGIHPLAALGAQTSSFQPLAITETGTGRAMQQMGQGVSNAAQAYYQAKNNAEVLELQKDKLRAEINALNADTYKNMGQTQNIQTTDGSIIPGQFGVTDGMRATKARVRTVPVTQEMKNRRAGIMRAGVHPTLTWEEGPRGLILSAGPSAVGIEEDPGKVIRLQKYINVDLPRQSAKYFLKRNRRGPGWRKFKREIMQLTPDRHPGKGKTWQWSFQQATFVRRKYGAPFFEDTSGLNQPGWFRN